MDVDYIARRRYRTISWIAFAGAALTGLQAMAILLQGEEVCLNEGCRIVGGLTRVPPLAFSLFGLGWFLVVALLMRSAARRAPWGMNWGMLLLLAGMAAEGALLGYQLFVARTLCAYCLAVFALVLAMNLAAGWGHVVAAGAVLAAALTAFSALDFGLFLPSTPGRPAIHGGTFAVRRCADPVKELHLVFSSNCPHCEAVISALEACTSCDFHFNPVDRIDLLALEGIERTAGYDPAVNRALLRLLGIDQVPVLIAAGPEGFSVVSGEKRILAYVRAECFRTEPVLNVDPSRTLGDDSVQLFRTGDDDGCSLQVECDEEGEPVPEDPFSLPPRP